MSASGLAELQAAIYARLAGDVSVTSLVTGVYDAVPEGAAYPYLAIGDYTETENRAFGRNGHEVTATLHVYDLDGVTFKGQAARGTKRALGILTAVVASLEAMAGGVASHTLVAATYEFGQPIREPDDSGGMFRHIPARFRFVLEDV